MLPLDAWLAPRPPGQRAALSLGTMNFGKRTPAAEAARIVARAIERGVVHVDTANVYGDGVAETIVGEALRGKRDAVVIATKVGLLRRGEGPEGLSAARIRASIDESRRRLGVETVDIYYLHAPDPKVALEETIGAAAELAAQGAIRALGVSNFASWQILSMAPLAAAAGLARPSISQVIYNLLIRQIEIEYLAFASAYRVHNTVYNALAGGLLSGRHALEVGVPKGSRFDRNAIYQRRYWSERLFALVDAYRAVATSEGMTLVELSYAWLASRPGVDSILLGPASVEQLDDAIDACARDLSPEALISIDEIHGAFLGTDARYAR